MSIGVHRSGPRPVPTSGLLGPGSAGKRLKITGFGVQSLGTPTRRGCTLGGNFKFVEGLKSVILGIWHTPGAPETLPRSWGASPPTFCQGLRAPGAAQTPKIAKFRPSNKFKISWPTKMQTRKRPRVHLGTSGTPGRPWEFPGVPGVPQALPQIGYLKAVWLDLFWGGVFWEGPGRPTEDLGEPPGASGAPRARAKSLSDGRPYRRATSAEPYKFTLGTWRQSGRICGVRF
jgi:hypothetical protein